MIYYVNPLYFWKGKLSDRINSIEVSYKEGMSILKI